MDPLTVGIAGLAGFGLYKLATKPTVSIPKTPPPVNPQNTGGGGSGNTKDPIGSGLSNTVNPTNYNNVDNQFLQKGEQDLGQLAKGNYVGAVFDYVKIASGQSLQIREGAESYLGKTSVTDNAVQPAALAVGGAAAALLVLAGASAVYAIPIAAFVFAIIDAAQIVEEKQRMAEYDSLKLKQSNFIDARHYQEAMGIASQANADGFNGWGFNVNPSLAASLVPTGNEATNAMDMIGVDSNGNPLQIMDSTGHSIDPTYIIGQAIGPLIDWYAQFRAANNNARPTRAQLNAAGADIFAFVDWVGFHFPWTICLKDPNGNDSKAGTPITGSGVYSAQYADSNGNWIAENITTALKTVSFNFPVAEDVSAAQGGTGGISTQQQQQNRQATQTQTQTNDSHGNQAANTSQNDDTGVGGGKATGQNKGQINNGGY